MNSLLASVAAALVLVLAASASANAQQVTRETVAGISNLHRLETTVACAGATAAEAIPEIKKMGFRTVINLRLASEAGANVEAEEAAAKAAGLRYYHVPFNGQSPDPAVAGRFLDAITAPGSEPAFIHCAGGNRAAVMWLIKRLAVDHWEVDRAVTEATALGLKSQPMKQFAIDYAKTHKK